MSQLAAFLHSFPVLCLFLSILLGTIIGRFHLKGVGFGSVVGTLLAGIVIGIVARPDLPELLRWSFFYLFLSPLMTLGGLAGAQTCTPGLTALREASGSNIGSLAYTVPYAIGNTS